MNTIQLAKNIAYMVQNGYYVAGHAIFADRNVLPKKILEEGFIIQDASKGISFTARYFESTFDDCLNNLFDLSKNSSGSVVIISIPKELLSSYEPKYFDSFDNTSILLELTGKCSDCYKDIHGVPTKLALLPSIYVLGYLNVQEDIFVKNPNYAFQIDSKNISISHLKSILDKRYEKILKKDM